MERYYWSFNVDQAVIDNLPKIIFPVAALLAGVLGGLFGIGGGLLMNPVLLQIGVPPQVNPTSSPEPKSPVKHILITLSPKPMF